MKILIGICGIGNGHLNRQTSVIEHLLEIGHEVVIATTDNNISYFHNKFNQLKIVNINIPWITCNTNGIDFKDSLNKYLNNNVDQYKSFFEFAIEVEKSFDGTPNLVITDYEPNVAQYSYAVNIPLICMEQQSKFLYLEEEKIENFSILEEKKRINYFFPKFNYKIISSFFPIDIKDERVEIVPPIIKKMNMIENKKNHVLVYFSPYSNHVKYKLVLNAIKNLKNTNFIVYSNLDFSEFNSDNIIFKKYGETFKEDLENCKFLITTAGHQLLSEAISINIPVYLLPLDTYEQNYNALMIEKYNLGVIGRDDYQNELKLFEENYQNYSNNVEKFKKKYYCKDWKESLTKIINKND